MDAGEQASAARSDEEGIGSRRVITPVRLIAVCIGLLLILAAVWTVLANRTELDRAVAAIERAPWHIVLLVVLLPLVNWICTTGTIWVLTQRYARVPFREMLPLIGSAWLLNMLPLRLGMIGRVAYHKKYHGLRVRDCAKVMVQALGTSAISLALLVIGVLMLGLVLDRVRSGGGGGGSGSEGGAAYWAMTLCVLALPATGVLGGTILVLRRPRFGSRAWRWPAAVLIRYVDMLVWFVRYTIVFTMLGQPLSPMTVATVTISAQAAMVTPVQFGLREWAVGMTTAVLDDAALARKPGDDEAKAKQERESEGISPPTPSTVLARSTRGLMSDACMRASELAIILPVGLASTLWVARSIRKGTRRANSGSE